MLSIKRQLQRSNELAASPSPTSDIEHLLCFVLNKPHYYLFAYGEVELTTRQLTMFDGAIKRRQAGEPIAYITGKKFFFEHCFIVNRHTLIPRPDTEVLVEFVLLHSTNTAATLCDLGTGSGAIGLSIAKQRSKMQIVLVDKCSAALAVARQNKRQLATCNVRCVESDWLQNLGTEKFNWIVANPPYIAADDSHLKQRELGFEPQTALISGSSGLDDIVKIQQQAKNNLVAGGYLLFEVGYNQSDAVSDLLYSNQYRQIEVIKDYNNINRAVCARFYP